MPVLAAAVLLIGVGTASSQQREVGGDELLLLAAMRTGTMAEELDDASSRGYRVLSAAGGSDFNEVIVVLAPSAERYEYRLVATDRTSTFEAELQEAGQAGYRLLPRTVTTKENASLFSDDSHELLAILERASEPGPAFRYQILATLRTGTLQEELRQAAVNGWQLVTVVVRGEAIAILERHEE